MRISGSVSIKTLIALGVVGASGLAAAQSSSTQAASAAAAAVPSSNPALAAGLLTATGAATASTIGSTVGAIAGGAAGGGAAFSALPAGVTRLATLTLEDEYFLSLTNRLVEKVGKDKLILAETVLPADTDYGAVLLRIKASKPHAILLNAGPKQLTSMLKWLHEQRVESKLFSNFLVSTPDVIAASGDAAEGVVFVQLDYDKPKFREYLKQAFGTEDSSPVGFSCLVGLATVLQTIDRTKSQPELLTAQLLRVEKVDVLGETVTFANREAQLNLVPRRIHGGSVQPL